ncbi:MAG TPA: IS66 family transposase, partial [Sandaracinaceae bacterium LLY-WYZ-13_1]|nr:IS66 family transposase [Sandaracinaceae bacterium LLY-WYZ-13_1]
MDVEGVCAELSRLLDEGRTEPALELVAELLNRLRDENLRLGVEVSKLLKRHTGRRGEGVSTDQLELFLKALGDEQGSGDEDATGEADAESSETDAETGEADAESSESTDDDKRKRPRRRKLPGDLPRTPRVIEVPEEQRACPEHGDKSCIGYAESEVLHFEPARFWVEVIRREKLACRECAGQVAVAPAANKIVEGGMAGPGVVADLLIGKFQDHLPLNRQIKRYARLGVKLPSSTVGDWLGQGADLLEPLARLEAQNVLDAFVLQTDDSSLKVLDRTKAGNIKRGYLWVHVGDGRHCYVLYTPNKEYAKADNPALEFLEKRNGYIQADAFPGYDTVFADPAAESIEVGCWMHARRYFVEALDGGDLRAAIAVKLIKKMYEVEAEATKARASPDERLARRHERTSPLLNELGQWIADTYQELRPKSPLAKAMGYTMRQWTALRRVLEDGRLPLDNGESERRLRDVAMGRRNYLFAGSDTGAERAAIVYSILGGCALNGV